MNAQEEREAMLGAIVRLCGEYSALLKVVNENIVDKDGVLREEARGFVAELTSVDPQSPAVFFYCLAQIVRTGHDYLLRQEVRAFLLKPDTSLKELVALVNQLRQAKR